MAVKSFWDVLVPILLTFEPVPETTRSIDDHLQAYDVGTWEIGPHETTEFFLAMPYEAVDDNAAFMDEVFLRAPDVEGWTITRHRPPRQLGAYYPRTFRDQFIELPTAELRFVAAVFPDTMMEIDVYLPDDLFETYSDDVTDVIAGDVLEAILGTELYFDHLESFFVYPRSELTSPGIAANDLYAAVTATLDEQSSQ